MGDLAELISRVIKYNAQTTGRDKVCRLGQFTSKFLKWYWTEHGVDKALVKKCQNLENALSSTRKAIRIGRSLDMIQSAIGSLKVENSVIRWCLVVMKLNMAGYLFIDHFLWAAKLELIRSDPKRLARMAAWFWLVAILASLTRNIYNITAIIRAERSRQQKLRQQKLQKGFIREAALDVAGPVVKTGVVSRLLADRPLVVDTLKNAADVFLPLATLELIRTSEGFQGIMGMISSYMGLLATWNPALRLIPS